MKWGVVLLMVIVSTVVLLSMRTILGPDKMWEFLSML